MTETLTIGFDAKRIVRNDTGLGNYGRTLINDMAARSDGGLMFRLYAPDQGRDELRNRIRKSPCVEFAYPKDAFLPFDKALWRIGGIVKDLKRDKVSLYHGLTGELPRGISKSGIKTVVTIHDLIFLRHPEYYNWIDQRLYAWKFRIACKEADKIIAISECTKRDIMELGQVDCSKIQVIYQSHAPQYHDKVEVRNLHGVRVAYGLPKRYILNVGTIEERKNILLAVKALQRLPEDLALVIVGRNTSYTNEVMSYVEDNQLSHRVFILNGVPDDHLHALYKEAEAFVYPSRYEGFGIPIIEAISCGLPVVGCTGSCLEEAGGPDCLYVSPDDDETMAHAISRMLVGAEGREERISRSQEYIRRFEGTDVAGQVLDIYRELL